MRLDKFLSVSRLIRRRSFAKRAADEGLVLVNGKVAKGSKNISVGDKITIMYPGHTLSIVVRQLLVGNLPKKEAYLLYDILSDEKN